jgi:hypothetical protein
LVRRKTCQTTLFHRFQISKGFGLQTLTAAPKKRSFFQIFPNIKEATPEK